MKESELSEIECWKQLLEFPEYQISSLGSVKNTSSGKINKGSVNQAGYLLHRFYYYDAEGKRHSKDIRTHLLVAQYFVPNEDPSLFTYVQHLDQNLLNAKASNLKWVSKKKLLPKSPEVFQTRSTSKPICEYDLKGNLVRIWCGATAIAKVYPIAARTIHDPCMHKTKTAYGRQWRYYEETQGIKIAAVNLKPYDLNLLNQKIKNKLYHHHVEVPSMYLYQEDPQSEYIEELNQLIKQSPLTAQQKNTLRSIQNYISQLEGIITELSNRDSIADLEPDSKQLTLHILEKTNGSNKKGD